MDPHLIAELQRQEKRQQFWQLFEAAYGPRRDLLLVTAGVSLPLFVIGFAQPWFSREFTFATAGFMVLLVAAFGLIPAYRIREYFADHPEEIDLFMVQTITTRYFSSLLYSSMIERERLSGERTFLELKGFERTYDWISQHPWSILLAVILIVVLVAAVSFGLQELLL